MDNKQDEAKKETPQTESQEPEKKKKQKFKMFVSHVPGEAVKIKANFIPPKLIGWGICKEITNVFEATYMRLQMQMQQREMQKNRIIKPGVINGLKQASGKFKKKIFGK
jgi:hypothetical protein